MKKYFLVLIGLLILCSQATAEELPDGYSIAKKQDDLDAGFKDESSVGKMQLRSASGAIAEREFEIKRLEKSSTGGEKSLIKFILPADIQGTGLLSYQNQNRDDDQWLYLPAMKKTKRIAGTGKGGSFVGSEFSYEDLMPLTLDKYSYTHVRNEACDDQNCFVVEATPKTSDSAYSKTVMWIRPDNYRTVKADFYDKKGSLLKTALFSDWHLEAGKFWRSYKIEISNHQNKKATTLIVSRLKIGQGLTESDLSQMALEK